MHLSCNSVCICAMLIWSAGYCADYYSKNWHTQSCLRWEEWASQVAQS